MVYSTDHLNDIVEEYVEQTVSSATDVEEIWLFGSYLNGSPNEDSDIDIAVVSERFAEDYPGTIADMCRAVWNMKSGPDIQIHGFTLSDFESDILAKEVKKSGRRVYLKLSE